MKTLEANMVQSPVSDDELVRMLNRFVNQSGSYEYTEEELAKLFKKDVQWVRENLKK